MVVDSIPLNVPYISQIDPAWKNNSYNFLAGKNISELGCALTSAAMILKYHGINSLPDNSELNPGTLNNWLKNRPDGYIKGDLNWEAIAVLAKKVHDVQGAGTKLLFRWGSGSQTEINNDLNSLQPVVLEINSADSPSGKHYVVAKGPAETGFEISDPLTADNNTLNSLNSTRRFIPTNTDLSALYLVADPEVNILVTDAAGRKLGKSGNNNFSQIPDAVFGTGGEIADDQNSGYTTPKYSFVFVASPSGQVFDVQLQSPILKNYTLTNYSYDQDGEVKIATSSGIISSDFLPEHNLFYSSSTASASTAEKKVTFTTAVKEVNNAKELNQISRSSLTLTLKRILSAAEKETKPTPRKRILNVFLRELDRQKDKAISESAYSILKEDALYLLNH